MGKEWDKLSGQPGYVEKARITDRPTALNKYSTQGRGVNSYQAGKPMQEWHERWAREALRVLRPGGYLLAFGSPRTVHRLGCAIEDAGFEIRDRIVVEASGERIVMAHPTELAWGYGSGFPKSLDVSKAIDKAAGAEREVVGYDETRARPNRLYEGGAIGNIGGTGKASDRTDNGATITAPATEDAARWEGWGTALKPAYEPVIVARKPLGEGNVASNVLRYGTGAINIGACRLSSEPRLTGTVNEHVESGVSGIFGRDGRTTRQQAYDERQESDPVGRWPANVMLLHSEGCVQVGERKVRSSQPAVFNRSAAENEGNTGAAFGKESRPAGHVTPGYGDADGMETVESWECVEGCPVGSLDRQTGILAAGNHPALRSARPDEKVYGSGWSSGTGQERRPTEEGGASRFFYCAKTGRAERDAGLDDSFELRPLNWSSGDENPGSFQSEGTQRSARNDHPTVKPIAVMRWLVKLVTRPGGLVLDPFTGSGTTGIAAALEGFEFVGIEQDERNVRIAEARIKFWRDGGEGALDRMLVEERAVALASRRREEVADAGQLDLLS